MLYRKKKDSDHNPWENGSEFFRHGKLFPFEQALLVHLHPEGDEGQRDEKDLADKQGNFHLCLFLLRVCAPVKEIGNHPNQVGNPDKQPKKIGGNPIGEHGEAGKQEQEEIEG